MKSINHKIYFIDTVQDYYTLSKTKIYSENGIEFPVLYPLMVHKNLVEANDYNPNHVAKDKMQLLKTSIVENGFAFGIYAIFDKKLEKFVIVDGDHRNQITGEKWLNLTYKPLIISNHSIEKRLAATVQFNKARGVHRVEGNAELIRRMVDAGAEDIVICKSLGIDAEELLRMKRLRKIADVYKDRDFSNSWEVV
jgi:ParB-like chromosome segregation protein Spo0J